MIPGGHENIGAVVIGRNEGARLKRCLASVLSQIGHVVYVDSGSTDGSTDFARTLGIEALDLDMSSPFSAGRARNAGFEGLKSRLPQLEYVQFIDGDCELCEGWVEVAEAFLRSNSSHAIVAGRVKERHPERSVYNALCDIEWHRPSGDVTSCGGIFFARSEAFSSAGGFNPSMIAGEEPELCLRLRAGGMKICSLDYQMTLHDADMLHFWQWWKLTVRGGYAYAHRLSLKGRKSDAALLRATLRIWFWSLGIPGLAALAAVMIGPWALVLLLSYLVPLYRGYNGSLMQGNDRRASFRYSLFNVLGKWPELLGQMDFLFKRALGRKFTIIEHK